RAPRPRTGRRPRPPRPSPSWRRRPRSVTGDTCAHGIDPGADELAFGLQRAFDVAHRYLAHRDRTEAEVRGRLAQAEIEPALTEHVVETLLDQRYIDDRRFAARFAEDRRHLDGWGSERIEERLIDLGVDRQLAADAA